MRLDRELQPERSRSGWSSCHELLAWCCAVITQNGGVARELTPTDWERLRDIPTG